MAMTPMLQQYFEIKKQYEDCILFFRLGDFYEMFGQDALIAAPILDITLTKRNKGKENEIPMCGVPHHAANQYIAKLTKKGKKVALCDQTSDASLPGLVKRDVVSVITPGTTLDEQVISGKIHNFLMSIVYKNKIWGVSCCDFSTGEFTVFETKDLFELKQYVFKKQPSELIITSHTEHTLQEKDILLDELFFQVVDEEVFDVQTFLLNYFKLQNFDSYGLQQITTGFHAATLILNYIKDTQKKKVAHITKLIYDFQEKGLVIDQNTYRNLEIFSSLQGEKWGSLIEILDQTATAMGARRLREWMMSPSSDLQIITRRHDAIEYFVSNQTISQQIYSILQQCCDLFRVGGKIGCYKANPLDLQTLVQSLELMSELKQILTEVSPELIKKINDNIELHTSFINIIKERIDDHPAVSLQQGGFIKTGFHAEVDEYRYLMNSGKEVIKQIQEKEIQNTGINSLKVKFNKVFGYYIEVSKTNLKSVPNYFIRKQTLVNAERFITPELKEYEEKVLSAEEKLYTLEFQLYQELLQELTPFLKEIQKTADALANLDVLLTLSHIAVKQNYVKPEMIQQGELEITAARHPVIEQLLDQPYIPNDLTLSADEYILILTGPNMAGKSSFLRQNALIIFLAHIGSFVPAEKARIPLYDKLFSRVGASDNLAKGQSTFMVEMQETAHILHTCTNKSFIILDELGRGTSTYDGVSIAMAVINYLHSHFKAHVLFATHYHELISFADSLDGVCNYSVQVKENDKEGVVFLYQIQKGGTDKSYGIEVAKLAGIPSTIIEEANHYLHQFTQTHDVKQKSLFENKPTQKVDPSNIQRYIKKISSINVNELTPLEAMSVLDNLQKDIPESNV